MLLTISIVITVVTLIALITTFLYRSSGATETSLAIGITLSVLAGILTYGLIMHGLRIEYFAPRFLVPFVDTAAQIAGAAAGFALFQWGRIHIQTKHLAVITALNSRLDFCPTLEEGDGWLPLGIMDAIEVNGKAFDIKIDPFETLSKELVTVGIDLAISVEVFCPNRYQNVENVEKMIQDLAHRAARTCVNDITTKRTVTQDSFISNSVRDELNKELATWGISVALSKASNIRIPDEITQANQLLEVEKAQRKAEVYEAETLKKKVQVLMDEFEDKGLTTKDAINFLQAESSKITRKVFELENFNSADVARSLIAFVEALRMGTANTGAAS